MTFSAKSNIYEVNARSTLAVYGDFINGTGAEVVLVLGTQHASNAATSAIASSMKALGYGERCCAFVVLEAGDMSLGANDLMSIVEGLDPLTIIVRDEAAASLLGRAYQCDPALDAEGRIMGRKVIAFRNFEGMLGDSNRKQKAWALLKKLQRG